MTELIREIWRRFKKYIYYRFHVLIFSQWLNLELVCSINNIRIFLMRFIDVGTDTKMFN